MLVSAVRDQTVGLTPEFRGCARLGHRLTPVITWRGPHGSGAALIIVVTTHVSASVQTGPEGPPASHVSAIPGRCIGLTPEFRGCARLDHRLTPVVTSRKPWPS